MCENAMNSMLVWRYSLSDKFNVEHILEKEQVNILKRLAEYYTRFKNVNEEDDELY